MTTAAMTPTPEPVAEAGGVGESKMERHAGWWTFDRKANDDHDERLYYFAPADRTPPPYKTQRHVKAIIDIAHDGTLAGVELIDDMPLPPRTAQPPQPTLTADAGAISVALGLLSSAIKSGEQWSEQCEAANKAAHDALIRLSAPPQPTGDVGELVEHARADLSALEETIAALRPIRRKPFEDKIYNILLACAQSIRELLDAVVQGDSRLSATAKVLRYWQEELTHLESMKARHNLTKDYGEAALHKARKIVEQLTEALSGTKSEGSDNAALSPTEPAGRG